MPLAVPDDFDGQLLAPLFDQFAEGVTYTHAGGDTLAISGILDEAYRELIPQGGVLAYTTERPVCGVRLVEFGDSPPHQGDALTVDRTGNVYEVQEVRLDGHGAAKLMLNWIDAAAL
ncbi:head-tail joining protein [Paraburkholderia caffeinilytica]|uniref:head-tail joining protein n=1 Tax=Paraburkholderia caffeinilytica TaxID=1761016 RepID=UPI003DA105C2